MKKIVFLIIISFSCIVTMNLQIAVADQSEVEKEVRSFLEAYAKAYEKKDLNTIMAMLSPDPTVVFVDADNQTSVTGQAKIKELYEQDFSRVESVSTQYNWISVGSKCDIAWFAADISANVTIEKEKFTVPAHWTGILEKRNGKWLIIQSHFSFAPMEEKEENKNQ